MEFSCIYIQLAVGSSLKSSVVLIYRLCRENDGQKVENGMLSAALCAGSVTVIVALLSCRKYFNQDNRLHCAQEVIYFHSCWNKKLQYPYWSDWNRNFILKNRFRCNAYMRSVVQEVKHNSGWFFNYKGSNNNKKGSYIYTF